MTHNLDAIVFVYRNHKDKKIKAEYFEKARLLEDSPDWKHIATLEPRMWIEFNYDTIAKQEQEPVAIEYWMQDTMESGRWVTTDNMEKVTAEKMLSGEYGNVYPQGRIVNPSPPQRTWVGLTKDEIREVLNKFENDNGHVQVGLSFARAIEAKLKQKNGYAEEKN